MTVQLTSAQVERIFRLMERGFRAPEALATVDAERDAPKTVDDGKRGE